MSPKAAFLLESIRLHLAFSFDPINDRKAICKELECSEVEHELEVLHALTRKRKNDFKLK